MTTTAKQLPLYFIQLELQQGAIAMHRILNAETGALDKEEKENTFFTDFWIALKAYKEIKKAKNPNNAQLIKRTFTIKHGATDTIIKTTGNKESLDIATIAIPAYAHIDNDYIEQLEKATPALQLQYNAA